MSQRVDWEIPKNGEKLSILAAVLIYLAFQVNAVFHHGWWGQDFAMHKKWMAEAISRPWYFLWHLDPTRTGLPLYEWLTGTVYKILNGRHWLEVVALLSIAFNTAALLLLYSLLRRFISRALIRLACFFFIVFAPFAMITAVVYGADSITLPLFIIMLSLIVHVPHFADDRRKFWLIVIALVFCLIFAIGNKMTFVTQIPSVLLSLIALYRVGLLQKDQLIRASIVIAVICGAPILTAKAHTHGEYNFPFGKVPGSEMSLRDILFFRKADPHVLSAPAYNEQSPVDAPAQGVWPAHNHNLLIKDKFSYPALLHLAIYTDIMNIYQDDRRGGEFGERSVVNRRRMRRAVRTGLLFSIAFLILTPIAAVRSLYSTFIQKRVDSVGLAIVTICGSIWYLNIVAGFPFVMAYIGGYWLPRLVVPALICFFLLSFSEADRLLRSRSRAWSAAILFLVIIQAGLQLSFLWPTGR